MSRPDTSKRSPEEEKERRKMTDTMRELVKSIEEYVNDKDQNYFTLRSLDLPRGSESYGDAIRRLYEIGYVDKYREVSRGNTHTWTLADNDNVR